jgi:L-fuconolactonase
MRVDSHQHFWHYTPTRDAWITDAMVALKRDFLPEDLESQLSANGFDGSVAVQADQSVDETRFLLQLAERNPFVLGVVGWVDLRAADLEEQLQDFSGFERLCGVRHVAQAEPDEFLMREDVVRGVGLLRDFDLSYDLLVYPRQLPAALSLVEQLPDQHFVVDHAAKPHVRDNEMEPWATRMRALASHDNVWCKVSGLVTEASWNSWTPNMFRPYLDVVFEAFGPDRLMFGSDWPVCKLAASYSQVVELIEDYAVHFSVAERESLFGGNAVRFYGLRV